MKLRNDSNSLEGFCCTWLSLAMDPTPLPLPLCIVCMFQTLATLLSSTPLTARGPTQIMVFDIHALQERFYFSENVIPRYALALLITILCYYDC